MFSHLNLCNASLPIILISTKGKKDTIYLILGEFNYSKHIFVFSFTTSTDICVYIPYYYIFLANDNIEFPQNDL